MGLFIPASYQGHAISFVKYGPFLAKCDRGENSQFESSVTIYKINNLEAANIEFFKFLIYKKHTDEFMHQGINQLLGLRTLMQLPLEPQESGNCSWANVEATVPSMLFLLLLEEHSNIDQAKRDAMHFYDEWRKWDQDRALDEAVQSFKRSNKFRRSAKAALLATVLFQRCDYLIEHDIERAEKILSVISNEPYNCFLNSFAQVYGLERKTKKGKDFIH